MMKIENNIRKDIGSRIKKIRESKQLTQVQLAESVGILQTTLSKIESGKFSISVDMLNKICNALNCSVEIIEAAE